MTLAQFVDAQAAALAIPGVAVGVWADGQATFACSGTISLENPLPVTADTLFLIASLTKTYTASALMRLEAEGRVSLSAPVRRYLPDFELPDGAAETITVGQLLNHTAGLDWGPIIDTGEGDDALASYVTALGKVRMVDAPGARASYSQAGYNVAGRVIEAATGLSYEAAIGQLILEPLALNDSHFSRDEVMTRRFCVGHNLDHDGVARVARLWRRWRGDNPGGGLASSVSDQLRWARFHLGDDDARGDVLSREARARMQERTVALEAGALGEAIGIGWFLREIDGVRLVGHGGSANGQFTELQMAPDQGFAVVSMSNCGPDGIAFNQRVVAWALQEHLGITAVQTRAEAFDHARAADLAGCFETDAMTADIRVENGALVIEAHIRPEIRAGAATELPPDNPPARLGFLPAPKDGYVILSGALEGLSGPFTRDGGGRVIGVDIGGRLFRRVAAER